MAQDKIYISKTEYYRADKPSTKGDTIARDIYHEKDLGLITGTMVESTGKVMKEGQVRDSQGGRKHR